MSKRTLSFLALLCLALPSRVVADEPEGNWAESHAQGITIATVVQKTIVINGQGQTCGMIAGVFRVYLVSDEGVEFECRWQTRCTCTNDVSVGSIYTVEYFVTDVGGKLIVTAIYPGPGG